MVWSCSQRGQTEVVCSLERRDSEWKDAEFGTGRLEVWMEDMKVPGVGDYEELVMNDFGSSIWGTGQWRRSRGRRSIGRRRNVV